MINLTTAQFELLRAVAAADDGAMDMPANAKAARALIKKGQAICLSQGDAPNRLIVTDTGRAALTATGAQADPRSNTKRSSRAAISQAVPSAGPPKADPKGKLGELVKLLRRPGGSTIEVMMKATGWQAHSVRGAMSGSLKKKLGFQIASEKTDAGRIYRIVDGAAA